MISRVSFRHYHDAKKQEPNLPQELSNSSIADVILSTIKDIPVSGSFGSKLDTLIRHIKYLRTRDSKDSIYNTNTELAESGSEPISPHQSVKVLVFSQWEQVLEILGKGLTENGIKYVKLEGLYANRGKTKGEAVTQFREDPECAVFMLNAKSQSQGLTLVAATHVFLVEPVINTALELQGRCHVLLWIVASSLF